MINVFTTAGDNRHAAYMLTKIVSKYGERRVSYTAPTIYAAHIAILGVIPSEAVIKARREATAYYTNDMEDAIDTSIHMASSALSNPAQLIAERDLPTGYVLNPSHAARFADLVLGN